MSISTFREALQAIRVNSRSERDKGDKFERLIKNWLLTDNRFEQLDNVWMWADFPSRDSFGAGQDLGIDLIARTKGGEYWAIQCKCYDAQYMVEKKDVDTFLSTSSKKFRDPFAVNEYRTFSLRVFISTTNRWTTNAESTLAGQFPEVKRINLEELEESNVDWEKLLLGRTGATRSSKKPHSFQQEAVDAAVAHFAEHDRGRLIMACGTGKTFTSLKIADTLLHKKGLVLFMVPSIALIGQAMNEWYANSARGHLRAVCICSDAQASHRRQGEDGAADSILDLPMGACTDARQICNQLLALRKHASKGLLAVFCTYQSVDVLSRAQSEVLRRTGDAFGEFDLVICDEAHRTTGVSAEGTDGSAFTRIHHNSVVKARRRLYMTATPRIYRENAKIVASEKDYVLASMDDEKLYGGEFYRVSFSQAVALGCLTDYKVLVLTVSEKDLTPAIREKVKSTSYESLSYETACKFVGTIAALSKNILGDNGETWRTDPTVVHRAMVFCNCIGAEDMLESSKHVAKELPAVCKDYREAHSLPSEHMVHIEAKHVDGSMGTLKRNEILDWLRQPGDSPFSCKVVSNVRCLSEGVDVPSLDAVVFLTPRNSQVDIVQSVGRVMRNFRKGKADEKKYGYIVIPVVVPANADAKQWMDDNETFRTVWGVLNALRSHDERFNAYVNSISLNKKDGKPAPGDGQKGGTITLGTVPYPADDGFGTLEAHEDNADTYHQLVFQGLTLKDYEKGFYAKLVEKCGDRLYWERWAVRMGEIARGVADRITTMLEKGEHTREFADFVKGLRKNINDGIDSRQAITMLAQHYVIHPIFDALFEDYDFAHNNSVSRSMQAMLDVLHDAGFDKDTQELARFRQSVRDNMGKIVTPEARQTVIKNLYERFFKGAFPETVEQLGIVYTPVECVDFIIHSVEHILREQFGTSLTAPDVHILDPFTGTGTFIVRLLQSGLIRPEDMERKYLHEIHCNEIVLLAYYVADVNIENAFHAATGRTPYLPYDGICLTDTFNLNEQSENDFFSKLFPENSARLTRQRKAPVRIIIGNPPYSVAKDAVDYPNLDSRIEETYVAHSNATLKRNLYDSYTRSFRWASDRISSNPEGGVVAFISNGSWLDSNAMDGVRACFQKEFSDIYVFDLRGNQRTQGEMSRKEGGKIFGSGSRTPVTITILVKNPSHKRKVAQIHYHDIGDYLTREDKLSIIEQAKSVCGLEWQNIVPNAKYDWIDQRSDTGFTQMILIGDKNSRKTNGVNNFFQFSSVGLSTNRDAWCYNSSVCELNKNAKRAISFFNKQIKNRQGYDFEELAGHADTDFHWTDATCRRANNHLCMDFDANSVRASMYRPFCAQNLFYYAPLIDRPSQTSALFPTQNVVNKIICVCGSKGGFNCLMSSAIPDLHFIGDTQCFPLYWYEEKTQVDLFDTEKGLVRRDGISDWILSEVRRRYNGTKRITKEHIFYFVYGILHSKQYRERFAADLKKSLPRLPIPESIEDFLAFEKAGRKLADLHLNYESVPPCPGVKVHGAESGNYRVEKMKHPKKGQTDTIIYNSTIRITDIPERAYEYIVNGKSAIAWVMERYAIKTDKDSGITNDPNDWAAEHSAPRYILDLLLSVINVSIQTMDIVDALPEIKGIS